MLKFFFFSQHIVRDHKLAIYSSTRTNTDYQESALFVQLLLPGLRRYFSMQHSKASRFFQQNGIFYQFFSLYIFFFALTV